jgi:3-oxoacyl-[acyl-carrier protein] reductase
VLKSKKMLFLVTGASRGIGFELVKRLSQRKGSLVIAVSRNPASLEKLVRSQDSQSILPLKADITTTSGRKKVVATVSNLGLGLDALINNAGLLVKQPYAKITYRQLETVYAANVFAPFALLQTLIPVMKKGSHVVNISSMGGVQGSAKFAGLSAYSSSKAALNGLTECLAEELRPQGIAVNSLALGAVQTGMLAKAFPGYKARLSPAQMAEYIADFAVNGHRFFNGRILPVSSSTP